MAKFQITSPDGQKYEVNAPDGATEQDAIDYVQNNLHTEKPETKSALSKLPRQLGLTARHGIQGLADTAGIFSDPLAAGANAIGSLIAPENSQQPQFNTLSSSTRNLLDRAGFPSPETSRERNVGEASKLLAGTGGLLKGVTGAANYLPKAAQGLNMIASRPGLQASSAIGAGYAGSETRERGGGAAEQFGASLLGGVGLPLSVAGLDSLVSRAGQSLKNIFSPAQLQKQADIAITQAGVQAETLPASVQSQLRQDVQNALKTGEQTSPDAIRRLADYRALNATPMRGNLTLNPVDITRDKNLAKIGANSLDPVQNQLANIQNANNKQLIGGLNELGANAADDAYGAGGKIIGALNARDAGAKKIIGQAYTSARNTEGRSANIDPHAFTQKANDLLDFNNVGSKLPIDIRNKMNSIAKGETPLTVDVAEQLKTSLYGLSKNEADGNVRTALSNVRTALDEAPLLGNQGQDAINAFTNARRLNASYMKNVEKTPALQAVRDGIEPDKFVQQYIIGNSNKSNVMDVAMLKKNIKGDQQATDAVRGQILSHLKSKGVSGAADEVANLSPSGYNKALTEIGDRKLKMFFDANEIEQLKRIGRVASYENVQPKGSAVNNSNTAAALFSSVIDGIGKYIPFGEAVVAKPVKNIATTLNARQALNASNALTLPTTRQPVSPALLPLGAQGLGLLTEQYRNNQ